jgi:TetR/AcrR family transcriptional regulator, regulator of cefoperazone and chloramphenicol sensitivity
MTHASEDLTARARIRDAALRLFADRGMDGATVRDIAKEAGVSPGLLRHHFGSKEALRDACDTYALDRLMEIKEKAYDGGGMAQPGFMVGAHPTILLLYRYLARSLADGSPGATRMYDEMIQLSEQWFADHGVESADPHGYAAVFVTQQIGMLVMQHQLSRALGADVLTTEGHLRMVSGLIEFHSHALLDPEMAAQARAALDQMRHPTPEKGTPR